MLFPCGLPEDKAVSLLPDRTTSLLAFVCHKRTHPPFPLCRLRRSMDPHLWRCFPRQCVDETARERLCASSTYWILIETQSCFAHFKPGSHKRTCLLNCYLMCSRLTTLSVLHSQASQITVFPQRTRPQFLRSLLGQLGCKPEIPVQ